LQEEELKKTQTEETSANEQTENVQTEQTAEQPETEAPKEEQAQAEPDAKDVQIAELQNRLLRLQADFDNFRRRTAGEKEQLSSFVTVGVVGKFLKVLDNFERAETSFAQKPELDSMLTGLKQIRRQFDEVFKELGVTEIEAQDKKFDPTLHEAVMRGQNPDMEDETIDMVFEKGYKLNDKVIRHSKVRVISNE
jgi:molecular chaperone GrpE